MPVIGHAFVGLAAGISLKPRRLPSSFFGQLLYRLWLPTSIFLAYVPDIASHLMALAGIRTGRLIAHSFMFTAVAALLLALLFHRIRFFSIAKAFMISFGAILGHILLDIGQSTDRIPLWPFSIRVVNFHLPDFPVGLYSETLFFGLGFISFLAIWKTMIAPRLLSQERHHESAFARMLTWVARILTGLIVLAAVLTHSLRDMREDKLYEAHALLGKKDYNGVLAAVAQADAWPYTAKPGRIDYLKASAHNGLWHKNLAEQYYLQSLQAAPDYFWSVADLAIFYSVSDKSVHKKKQLITPLLIHLKTKFADHKELTAHLERIKQGLGGNVSTSTQ